MLKVTEQEVAEPGLTCRYLREGHPSFKKNLKDTLSSYLLTKFNKMRLQYSFYRCSGVNAG